MRRNAAATAVLIALAVAVGMLLAAIPNVEGVSAISFFSGMMLGWRRGSLVGGTSMLLLSLLSPLGPAPPPVLGGQVVGMALVGAAGSAAGRAASLGVRLEVAAMGSGAVLTLSYDLLTNYGVAVSIGKWRDPWVVMLAGIPFGAIHVVSNTIIFGAVGALAARKPWLVRRARLARGKSPTKQVTPGQTNSTEER